MKTLLLTILLGVTAHAQTPSHYTVRYLIPEGGDSTIQYSTALEIQKQVAFWYKRDLGAVIKSGPAEYVALPEHIRAACRNIFQRTHCIRLTTQWSLDNLEPKAGVTSLFLYPPMPYNGRDHFAGVAIDTGIHWRGKGCFAVVKGTEFNTDGLDYYSARPILSIIAAHEIGHCLGLKHHQYLEEIQPNIMHPASSGVARRLEQETGVFPEPYFHEESRRQLIDTDKKWFTRAVRKKFKRKCRKALRAKRCLRRVIKGIEK